MDPPAVKRLLSRAPERNQVAFFQRQIDFLLAKRPAFGRSRGESLPTQFIVDNSAVIEKVASSLAGYARAARTLGYPEPAISYALRDVTGTSTLLPFDRFLDMLSEYEPPLPAARTLSHNDFLGANAEFPSGGEDRVFRPSGLQAKVIDHVFAETARLETGQVRGVIVMATGLGKSFLSAFLIDRQITESGGYAQFVQDPQQCVLFVVNSIFIRNQTCEKYQKYFSPLVSAVGQNPGESCTDRFLNVDTDSREGLACLRSQTSSRVKFVFCLFQSIHLLPERLRACVSHVIVDEAHHVAAPSYMSVVKRFAEAKNTRLMVGLTATLYHRADANAARIRKVFGGSVFADLPWTVAKELDLFPELRYFEYPWGAESAASSRRKAVPKYSLLKSALQHGELNMQQFCFQLSRSLRSAPRIDIEGADSKSEGSSGSGEFLDTVARELAAFLSSFRLSDPRRPKRVMAFLSSVKQIELFVKVFQPYQERAHAKICSAHYKVHHKRLSTLFSEFSSAPTPLSQTLILCTVSMATEGFDLPYVDCVVFMRRTESERVYVQQLGRCLRLHSSKPLSYALDFVYSLRLRWLRLRDELLDATLLSYIESFWEVEDLRAANSIGGGGLFNGAAELESLLARGGFVEPRLSIPDSRLQESRGRGLELGSSGSSGADLSECGCLHTAEGATKEISEAGRGLREGVVGRPDDGYNGESGGEGESESLTMLSDLDGFAGVSGFSALSGCSSVDVSEVPEELGAAHTPETSAGLETLEASNRSNAPRSVGSSSQASSCQPSDPRYRLRPQPQHQPQSRSQSLQSDLRGQEEMISIVSD